ncbi:MAG: 5'/3'-nucleotidase SurE [Spirochaetales bacterium]|nr:5'/3'-nucleotidase SurE [Spirochaetales bacterium]
MNILLTNDDGIDSEGLHVLAETLRKEHAVWIAAPDTERSASSHAITIRKPVVFTAVDEKTFSCSGTPADCILFALQGAVPVSPDIVISGINKGNNIGNDIVYSGTVAAAREGAYTGIPSIAVSASGFAPPFPFSQAADFILRHLNALISLWNEEIILNINVPEKSNGMWETASLSSLSYGNTLHVIKSEPETGSVTYLLKGEVERIGSAHDETDFVKLQKGIITVSPVSIYPSCHEKSMQKLDKHLVSRVTGI